MTDLDRSKLGPRQNLLVDALLSGKYPQCRGRLMNGDGYCCLGVATVVYNTENPSNQETLTGRTHLSSTVMDFFSFKEDNGAFDDPQEFCLVNVNDRGADFKEIAKLICEKADKLFNQVV